ncbi:amidohydrolase family protein [Janthinobacterium sp. GB4P2]|uniref:amidohydrolase family protein n=1 Tax=Janthinobacterium sp. GB4P2 TaxID=3424189 RepID=UPI003F211CEF
MAVSTRSTGRNRWRPPSPSPMANSSLWATLAAGMGDALEKVVRHLVEQRWPLRLHAKATPPVQRMLDAGVPLGGLALTEAAGRLSRDTALELWTAGSAWFSSEQGKKGRIREGMPADLSVLAGDYSTLPEEAIKSIVSVLTMMGGKVVSGQGPFSSLAPPLITVLRPGRRKPCCRTSARAPAACMRMPTTGRASRPCRLPIFPASGARWAAAASLSSR